MSTVKDALAQFYPGFKEVNTLSFQQAKAAEDILRCKTGALGGHVKKCVACDHLAVHYNSCRNRHCPMCQGVSNAVLGGRKKPGRDKRALFPCCVHPA